MLIGFGGWYGYQTYLLPARTLPHTPSPSFFPWLLTGALLALAACLLWQGLRDESPGRWLAEDPSVLIKPALGLLLLIGYVVVLPTLGFAGASIPFCAGLMRLSGARHWGRILLPSVAIPIALFGLFRYA